MFSLLRARSLPSSRLCHSFVNASFSTISHRRFCPSQLDYVEDIEAYKPGGLHPVAVGDIFSNGRYRVLHKLGFGGTSTIWLARDQQAPPSGKLMTLKVMRAEQSAEARDTIAELSIPQRLRKILQENHCTVLPHIQNIEDSFLHQGPNGTHLCLVSQLAGPSVRSMFDCPGRVSESRRLRSDLARKVARQVASAVQLMHSAGYVHGDLTTSNVLFQFSESVKQWSDDQLYSLLGEPETDMIATIDGSPPGSHAPTEIIAPIDNASLSPLQEDITMIDFGQSFSLDNPPEGYMPATTIHYASPEARFESRISLSSDIWALACTVFEIRAGSPLFEPFLGSEVDILRQTVQMLGKLPEPWWNTFEERRMWFEDNGDPKPADVQKHAGVWLPAVKSSIREELRKIGTQDEPAEAYEGPMIEKIGTRLEEDEIELLGDLLEQMLKYCREDRITIQDVLNHPWFRNYG
ncbi:kinase-like domain-containing protein [Abortiporus biennis]|nr:kinase-like domain-containing protein [Abortiporus biennis]